MTENLEEVNDGLLAGRGSRVVFQKANGARPVYIEPASIAYLEEVPSKKQWCRDHGVDDERRESIVNNKSGIADETNRSIGGAAPSKYLERIEKKAQIDASRLDALLEGHLVPSEHLRADAFDSFFVKRRERLCTLVEDATASRSSADIDAGRGRGRGDLRTVRNVNGDEALDEED